MKQSGRLLGSWRISMTILLILSLSFVAHAQTETLVFWSSGYKEPMQDWLRDVAFPEFERIHQVRIEYSDVPWGTDRDDKIAIAFAAGVAPDVYMNGDPGFALPLDRYIAAWPDRTQINSAIWSETLNKREQKAFRVPQFADMRGVAYNKRLFAEAGLAENEPPQSWDQFLETVKRLTRYDGDGATVQSGYETNWHSPAVAIEYDWWLKQAGGEPHSDDLRQTGIRSQEGLDTVRMLTEMFQTTHPQLGLWSSGIYWQGFGSRTVAMSLANVGMLNILAESDSVSVADMGLFAPRRYPSSAPVAISTVNGLSISTQSNNPDLAWELIKFLMSYEAQATFAQMADHLVVRNDVATDLSIPRIKDAAPWYEIMAHLRVYGFFTGQGEFGPYLVEAFEGKRSPESAWEQMAEAHQVALDRYWNE